MRDSGFTVLTTAEAAMGPAADVMQ